MRKTTVSVLLRMALALPLIYVAIASFAHPFDWLTFFPSFLKNHVDEKVLIGFSSFFDLLLAAWVLSGTYIFISSIFTAVFIGLIFITNLGSFSLIYGDLSIIFAATALAALSYPRSLNVRKYLITYQPHLRRRYPHHTEQTSQINEAKDLSKK